MLFKSVLIASAPLAAFAFVAPMARSPITRGRQLSMNFGYEQGGRPVGGVQFFPDSEKLWDPFNLYKDEDATWQWRLANGEIKNGRVAMLACLDYLVKGFGFRFPFHIGNVDTETVPGGLASLKALPLFGWWIPFFFMCGALDILTDSNGGTDWPGGNPGEAPWMLEHAPNRVPGNVQPLTDAFKAPGDEEIRTKEINNGRMAMISIFGIWAGELVTGGQQPLDTLYEKLGL